MMTRNGAVRFLCVLAFVATGLMAAAVEPIGADPGQQLSTPNGNTTDQAQKVKVFILMGKSNMVGMGRVTPTCVTSVG